MAVSFVFPIAGKVLEQIGSPVLEELSLAWGVRNELQKLKNTISSVRAVLLDAEEQQSSNHQLRVWLGKLKDALYNAEDVLDDFEIDALRRTRFPPSIMKKVFHFFSRSNQLAFRFKMGHKIKKVRETFDEIAADRTKFSLTERHEAEVVVVRREMTHSFVRLDDVIGRDNDTENIIQQLMHTNDCEEVSVIPIVGLGGLGKTTVAKMVYNDERIVKHFNLRIWVCISVDFGLEGVIKKILQSAIGADCSNLNIEQLQTRLREILQDKKYFLVLDDVWNEDRGRWIELENLLMVGARGSKIVVTTREESVALVMATNTCKYELEGLPDEDCLSLFLKWAFRTREDANRYPYLVEIGREIVKKCKGVPLAVRTLGDLLYMKTEERDWKHVRDNGMWKFEQKEDHILPVLKFSYSQLPFHLKQCFSYCSIFEKDYVFYEMEIINLWRAQGLIRLSSQNQNEDLEDIGKKYIEQLWSRGFFQDFGAHENEYHFKMHDLVHDLALSVAKSDCKILNSRDDVQSSNSKVRHISFPDGYLGDEIPRSLPEPEHVRTIYFHWKGVRHTNKSFIEKCISRFKYLRALNLPDSGVEVLSASIGSLKHLRLLILHENIEIKSLPEGICKLVGLETLGLYGCSELEMLPRDLGKLIRLKYLTITTKERCLSEKGIGSLTTLRYLAIGQCRNMEFLISDDEIKRLSALRTLLISDCESLVSLPTRGLRYLTTLELLGIQNCEKLDLMMGEATTTTVERVQFQGTGGLSSLRFLEISEIPKLASLPSWVLDGAYSLKKISIDECQNLAKLMPDWLLENIKFLQNLEINDCPQLTSLPEGMDRLAALNEIHIWKCPELIRRCQQGIGEDWQKISHVPNIYLSGVKI